MALTDAKRLDYYHRLERERVHLLLMDEASKGLDDVAASRVQDARAALTKSAGRVSPRGYVMARCLVHNVQLEGRGNRWRSRLLERPSRSVC